MKARGRVALWALAALAALAGAAAGACGTTPYADSGDTTLLGEDAAAEGASMVDATTSARADAGLDSPVDATSTDAAELDAAPPCPKTPDDGGCSAASECCSNACGEARKCASTCKPPSSTCSFGKNDCCLGTYCGVVSLFFQCLACHANGIKADVLSGGIPVARSCCSGAVDSTGTCN